MMNGTHMPVLDEGDKTAAISCPLTRADGTACPWSHDYAEPEVTPALLVEAYAPGVLKPTSRAYATWYQGMEKVISQHLVNAHPVEDWARTMTAMRADHHQVLESLHAGYNRQVADLLEDRSSLERSLNDRVKQLGTYAEKVQELEAGAKEEHELRGRLAELLTETANALKGPPAERQLHDWADLPEVAATKVAAVAARDDLLKAWIAKYEEAAAKLLQLEELTAQQAPAPSVTVIRAVIRNALRDHPNALSDGMDEAAVAVARLLEGAIMSPAGVAER